MTFYSYLFSSDYKLLKGRLKMMAKRIHKSYSLLLIDSYSCLLKYGVQLDEYLNYEFYRKNTTERLEYASNKVLNHFYDIVCPIKSGERLTNKIKFLNDFQKYTNRDFILPEKCSLDEFKSFLSKHETFISKSYNGLDKKDILKVNKEDIKDVEKFYQECIENKIILEELVKQNKVLNKLGESCNTIKVMTFNNHGKVEILWAGLRIGYGIQSIDNFWSRGMITEIDLKTGKLIRPAIDKSLNEYTYHPKTHVEIKGFKVPYFKRVKNLVKAVSSENSDIVVAIWDVAVTDERPLIIEGNCRSEFDLVQIASRCGRIDIINYILEQLKK